MHATMYLMYHSEKITAAVKMESKTTKGRMWVADPWILCIVLFYLIYSFNRISVCFMLLLFN